MPTWKLTMGIVVIAGAVFYLVLTPGEALDPALAGRPGAETYEKYCLRCHGGRGSGDKASRQAGRPLDFSSPAFADTADLADLRRTITRGKGKMKGYGDRLTPAEIDTVARFLLELAPSWE